MKRLLIVGAGGFGREVLAWTRDIEMTQSEWRVAGFLDVDPNALDGFETGMEVLGVESRIQPTKDDCFVCALGDPVRKQKICTTLLDRGAEFTTLVHPSAIVGPRCRIGAGSILCPGVILTTDIILGRCVTLNLGTTVGHDASIGDWSSLMVHVDIGGGAKLGQGVYAGSQSFVFPGVQVGDFAVVGAGSAVTRHLNARTTAFGVPARVISDKSAGS